MNYCCEKERQDREGLTIQKKRLINKQWNGVQAQVKAVYVRSIDVIGVKSINADIWREHNKSTANEICHW